MSMIYSLIQPSLSHLRDRGAMNLPLGSKFSSLQASLFEGKLGIAAKRRHGQLARLPSRVLPSTRDLSPCRAKPDVEAVSIGDEPIDFVAYLHGTNAGVGK